VVTFEPIPGEPLDCVRCGAYNAALPVEPLRRAWFAWTETPHGRWGVIRDDFSVAYESEAAVRGAVQSLSVAAEWRAAFRIAADEYRAMIAGYDPDAGEDGDSLPPDVYSALSTGADTIPYLDVSSLVDATLEAMGTGEGCCGGECLQAMWLWEDEHGHAAVLTVLERLATEVA